MSKCNRREHKAGRRLERARRQAVSPVPVLRQGRLPGPRADAVVRGFFDSFASDDPPAACRHIDLAWDLDGQPHAYWSSASPRAVRCGDCLERAALVLTACASCGTQADSLHMADVHLGTLTVTLGLCSPCHEADREDQQPQGDARDR